jgi:uncharacterized membrane protein (DUF2068 family)
MGVWQWLRWEFGRSIEVTGFIKLIIAERLIKGSLLVLGGIALVVLGDTHVLHQWALDLQDSLNLDSGKGWLKSLVETVIVKFGLLSTSKQVLIAVAAALYGALELGEAAGLLLRKRWAEYLVLVATAAFLPLEIDEVFKHVTVFKVGALLLNIAICAYLIWRKRLFLERPGRAATADATEPEPRLS